MLLLLGLLGCELDERSVISETCPTTLWSQPPLVLDEVGFIVPLGNLAPPGHVLPTPHTYWAAPSEDMSRDVVAPGDMTITSISVVNDLTRGTSDYSLNFQPCTSVRGVFRHLSELSSGLLDELVESECSSYQIDGQDWELCDYWIEVQVTAGTPLGVVGGVDIRSQQLDFGVVDFRETPTTFVSPNRRDGDMPYVVCPLDGFDGEMRETLEGKLGGFDGPPLDEIGCGKVAWDVAGTAQGQWFQVGAVGQDESPHLALVHHNVHTTQPAISVGPSVPDLSPGVYTYEVDENEWFNQDFLSMSSPGTHCVQGLTRLDGDRGEVPGSFWFALGDETLDLTYSESRNCAEPNGSEASVSFER
jgi:hypothetical protein